MRRRPSTVLVVPALLVALAGFVPVAVVEPVAGTVSFTASGDFAATANTTAVLDAVAASGSQFHLALGDLSYGATGQEQAWCDLVTSRLGAGFPFELLSGNHESNGQNGHINDFSACLPNQLPGVVGTYGRQWYVDVPTVNPVARFVMISPALPFPEGTASYAAGTPHYQWTAAAIDGARAAGIPWVVVGMHKPCLSLGQYVCDPGRDITDLLVQRRVDLVLHGHEHLYQRTHQLGLSPGCPSLTPEVWTPSCVVGSGPDLLKGAGTVFATVGTGGQGLRVVNTADPETPYFAAWSGSNADPTWGSIAVDLTADRLSARFQRGSGGTFADTWSITRGAAPVNQPPTAVQAVPACSGLVCSLDASLSSDPDGTIASFAWTFGDGTTGTGATPSHTYPAGGTYTATVVVTDNSGAKASAAQTFTVTAGAPAPLAADAFGRTTMTGWGPADVGGTWTVSAPSTGTSTSVTGGTGRLVNKTAASQVAAHLTGVQGTDTDLRASVSATSSGSGIGTGLFVNVYGRRVGTTGAYSGRLKLLSTGVVQASIMRSAGGTDTNLGTVNVPGGAYVANEPLQVRVSVAGTSPTTVRVKVWRVGTPEPAAWLLTTTDSTPALQVNGHVGFQSYLSSSATAWPVTVALDDLRVEAAAP